MSSDLTYKIPQVVKLGGIIELLTDYHANGAYEKLKENVELLDFCEYAVMIRTTNFEQLDFSSNLKFITEKAYNFLAKSKVLPGDLVMNKIANAGSVYLMPDLDRPVSLAMNLFLLRVDNKKANPVFVYMYLKINESYVKQFANGSVTKTITKDAVRNLEIHLPERRIQNGIAELYLDLTDRITLLRETNVTLEAIAQALFKSWFVDFDPVCAKAVGIEPQTMDATTAALFPDSFEESELGLVPKGWGISKLSAACGYLSRGVSPKYVDVGGVLVINQKCIRDFSVDYVKARRHDASQRNIDGRILVVGDVLVNSTGVGTLGRVAQVLELPEQTIVDSHVTVVRAGFTLSWPFLGQWMARKQPDIEAMGEGSTGQTELSKSKLGDLSLLVPLAPVLSAFDEVVMPLKSQIALNESKVKTLTQLRDTLLPRLISGQLRLPDAEAMLAEPG